jgi:hypothetical protein
MTNVVESAPPKWWLERGPVLTFAGVLLFGNPVIWSYFAGFSPPLLVGGGQAILTLVVLRLAFSRPSRLGSFAEILCFLAGGGLASLFYFPSL